MHHMAFDDLVTAFRTHKRAFHLEVRDDYSGVAGEAERMRRFLDGKPQDPAAGAGWQALMREVTGNGCVVQRVRVVSEPHGDYTRFAVGTTPGNLEAGEDIRWLPRQNAPSDLPEDDWWLFDDELVAYTVFERDGTALPGWAATRDPAIAGHCARRRDELWAKAVRHYEYG
ncbi:hypothetical protein GZH49_30185 [Nocardia terpenica]|uniref:DUF6879 domain-containing protein n=2 Tax=Nocardia terpenica TaxID=455432 RepID=A0A291RI42_9NOCA|nr:hypothetical protein CRH09_14600 [Nocardia terpenica]